MTSSVTLGRALLVVLERLLGAAGLDHHDRHVGAGLLAERPAGDDELERRGVALLVGGVREPRPVGRVRDAHGADRAVEGDARDHRAPPTRR